MGKTMIPFEDTITTGQIAKIQEDLGAALRKSGLLRAPMQQIIEHELAGFTAKALQILHKLAKEAKIIVHVPGIDPATKGVFGVRGWRQHIDSKVVATMPRSDGKEAEIVFFNSGRPIKKDDDLDEEYGSRGLEPANPHSLGLVNDTDPSFSDKYPNVTHWRDEFGRWCHVAFYRAGKDRCVSVSREGDGWHDFFWHAGVRKQTD